MTALQYGGGGENVVVGLHASYQGEPCSKTGGVAPGFSHVGIVPDDAARLRVFSGISRFPRPCIPMLLKTALAVAEHKTLIIISGVRQELPMRTDKPQ
ncbi:hypothetical protein PR048_003170 [Dryococelus australis]|uniref:Uncharacterized protein n=1 Tax=Dryococelus australis TaxID=614101 RepID=A0ABQ9IMV1_9NEOP|nr:hypothetical protein PR048_003170 [Dryococelus australis]